MDNYKFSNFIVNSLKLLFFPVLLVATVLLGMYIKRDMYLFVIIVIVIILALLFGLHYMINKKYSSKTIVTFLVISGFVIRLAWALSIDNKPISDFNRAYIVAGDFLNGNLSGFWGTHYIARFPHLTGLVLYFALIRYLFAYPLIVLKIINVILSSSNIVIIYMICKEVFQNNKKKAYYGAFISALYPPLVIYTAVFCTENMAIPLYLLSIYFFILGLRKNIRYMFAAGMTLMAGHFFRAVGQVIMVAYLMIIFIYLKDKIIYKAKKSLCIILAFIIPFLCINATLKYAGITQFDLWKGSETSWTSVLKGTNQSSWGRWNHEDAIMFDKYENNNEALAKACIDEIKRRLTTTPIDKLAIFYLRKYSFQWREGDFGASYWAILGLVDNGKMVINTEEKGALLFQIFYVILLILSYLSLYNKKGYLRNPKVIIFYIIFCGYSLFYLITESQDRYSFIACWVMIFMALNNSSETICVEESGEYMKFVFVNAVIPVLIYYVLLGLKINCVVSIFISYLISGTVNLINYRKEIFILSGRKDTLVKILISSLISIILSCLIVYGTVSNNIIDKKFSEIPAAILVLVINYLVYKIWIKKENINSLQTRNQSTEQEKINNYT